MVRPVAVRALPEHRIWIRFSDGVEGEVDLSGLVGKGVFSQWRDDAEFQKAHIGNGRSIVWDDQIDICADALYMEVTGKTPEEMFPRLKMEDVHF